MGFSFGHRDTDNLVRNCRIERNGTNGIFLREEDTVRDSPDRNTFEKCLIRDNGGDEGGINIMFVTNDTIIRDCTFESTQEGKQEVAVKISYGAGKVTIENNKYIGNSARLWDARTAPPK